jgi:hypothetical protein
MNIASATQQALSGLASAVTLDGASIAMFNRFPTSAAIFAAAGLLSPEYNCRLKWCRWYAGTGLQLSK